MATRRQLRSRWESSPGQEIRNQIYALGLIQPDHGHSAEDIFQLLNGLPFRDEVANGRDLRGLNIAASDLDLSNTDFSFGQLGAFYSCKLKGSCFDYTKAERATLHSDLTSCSFIGAIFRSCYFNDSIATNCNFSKARLRDCSFQKTDLRGSCFRDADCLGAQFAGANLLGCDFRGANLEEAVFCDVVLDKSTDFRGANLSNVNTSDWRDNQGNLTRKGVDLSLATL